MQSAYRNTYDPRRERHWHLSIWTGPTLTAWAAQDIRDGQCAALFSVGGSELPNTGELPVHPASVSFVAVPEWSTLVPESALVTGREPAYLELVHGPLPQGRFRHELVDALAAHCLYQHDEAAEKRLLDRFPSAHPIALQALLVKAALSRSGERPLLLLHRGDRAVDVVIAQRGTVLLANSFHALSAADVLYFTLFTLERTALDTANVQVLLAGPHLQPDERALIDRYLPNVAPAITLDAPVANTLKTSGSTSGMEAPERWLGLLEQWSCVS